MRNIASLVAATVFATGLFVGLGKADAQDNHLPDIGSSAGEVLGPAKQREYGEMALAQMRNYGYTLEDPLLAGWLQGVGDRLGAASDKPDQAYTLFLLKDRQINAFATLGGYVAVNAGLVLAANREDEVAAVLSHEFAHVTQSHVLRAVERAQRDSVPILLAMLGAIALSGMIMRNSVILVDQIEQDIAAGHDAWTAIVDATTRRFRPIVLTALAAILAMIPLTRSAFFGPMAVAIMGGLTVATALTLLFLPALYAAWFRVRVEERAT
jgi:hypothetical protein